MAVFKCWLKSMVELDRRTLDLTAQHLKGYLDQIIRQMPPNVFTHSVVGINPNSGDVQRKDVVVYLVKASLIARWADEEGYELVGGGRSPGGRTALCGEGVLSEVYLQGVANLGAGQQAIAIANAAIHEIAHNKFYGMEGIDANSHVHSNCGGGILAERVMPASLRSDPLTQENAKALAPALGREVNQMRTYLSQQAA